MVSRNRIKLFNLSRGKSTCSCLGAVQLKYNSIYDQVSIPLLFSDPRQY